MESGRLLTHPALARMRFRELASRPDGMVDLVEASLIIAQEDLPGLAIDPYLEQVNGWSAAVRERLEGSRDVERIVESINRLLFDEEGFRGEDEDYYDPRSALMNDKALSTYAHNIKIITQDGHVTLKGPVRTEDEKTAIGEKATQVAGAGNVTNHLKIAPPTR